VEKKNKLWNPYVAGIALGLVMLTSFMVAGHGLGASGTANRIGVAALNVVAPNHVAENSYLSKPIQGGKNAFDGWLVFQVLGMFLGGLVSSYAGGRLFKKIKKGKRISSRNRLILALLGGVIMGFAARMTRGCTSGQALSGGALLSVGSWIFMLSVFAGGYAVAYFVRRQWT